MCFGKAQSCNSDSEKLLRSRRPLLGWFFELPKNPREHEPKAMAQQFDRNEAMTIVKKRNKAMRISTGSFGSVCQIKRSTKPHEATRMSFSVVLV